jgi:hypothetical protein
LPPHLGKDYSRAGFVLGSSHIFGFALGSNGETLPSQLSQAFGYPVFGIAYPEADTRTLHATLLRLLRQYGKRTGIVILITGGDFTRYCYVESADPLSGPPILPIDPRLKRSADAQKAPFTLPPCGPRLAARWPSKRASPFFLATTSPSSKNPLPTPPSRHASSGSRAASCKRSGSALTAATRLSSSATGDFSPKPWG